MSFEKIKERTLVAIAKVPMSLLMGQEGLAIYPANECEISRQSFIPSPFFRT
jgi:hypothetical protein